MEIKVLSELPLAEIRKSIEQLSEREMRESLLELTFMLSKCFEKLGHFKWCVVLMLLRLGGDRGEVLFDEAEVARAEEVILGGVEVEAEQVGEVYRVEMQVSPDGSSSRSN